MVIYPSKYHRAVKGTELVKCREDMGLTQTEFAEKCGWSQQFQSRIERPGEHEITIDMAEKILLLIKAG